MPVNQHIVTVVGGSGFLGRYVVRELAKAGYRVRVICRHPQLAHFLKPAGHVGQIVIQQGDITRPETIKGKLDGSYAVINLVGKLYESGRQSFKNIHKEGAAFLAKEAWQCGAKRFIQVSALGVSEKSRSKYARTKAKGEEAVAKAFDGATIIRPSTLFGPEDDFFNKFARMARFSPVLPLIGGGKTRFQPVYVDDVALAIATCVADPHTHGTIYELGGPKVMRFKEILELVLRETGRKGRLVNLPFSVAKLLAGFTGWLPSPPLTRDQVRLLKSDSVVGPNAKTFADLGITPTHPEMIVPHYLKQYQKRHRTTVEPQHG